MSTESAFGSRPRFVCWSRYAIRRSLTRSWNHGASEKKRDRLVLSALSSTQRVLLARLWLSRTIRHVKSCWKWRHWHRFSKRSRKMSAWAVTMGAGATMGSCMSRLPFHPEDGIGPKSITLTPEMAKYNSRVPERREIEVTQLINDEAESAPE